MAELQAPPPGGPELDLLKFLDGLDQESGTYHAAYAEKWQVALDLFRGRIWPVKDKAPLFLVNAIAPNIDRQASLLADAKPLIRIMPRRRGLDMTARVLQETIGAGWDEYHLGTVMDDVGYHLNLFGAAFLSLEWDPLASHGAGDIVPLPVDPRTVRVDPAMTRAYNLSQAQYVITDSVVPLWHLWQRFPGRGQLVSADAVLTMPTDDQPAQGVVQRMLGGMSRWLPHSREARQQGAVPRARVRNYWFHDPTRNPDGTLKYPAGRHIIRNGDGDLVLLDEPNPYWDGAWPLVMVDNKHDPDHPWGRVEVLAFRRLQEAVNRIGHLFVENTLLAGNVWITADADALEPSVLQKLNNLGAIVLRKRFGRNVDRQAPPEMPAHFLEFIRFSLGLIEELSGLGDTTVSGRGRIELRSGLQLEGLQQAAQTLIRALARRVEGFLERLGRLWISRIFQFYTQDRMLAHLGPGPEWLTYGFERQQLLQDLLRGVVAGGPNGQTAEAVRQQVRLAWQDFHFRIIPGSSLSTVRVQRAQHMAELALNGMVSRVRVLEELGFANPEEEIDRALKEQQLLSQGQAPAQGSPPRRPAAAQVPGG